MLYSHETPKNLLEISRFFNDYDYALDIKFDDKDYFNFFKKSIEMGRTVILDNSLYERRITNVPFDEDLYVHYINTLKPTYYIVPDSYENSSDNINLFESWSRKTNLKILNNKITVVHGSDYEDYEKCYKYFDTRLREDDIIAFSGGDSNIVRAEAIKKLYLKGIINLKRKHHLLGLVHPNELIQYKYLDFISSVDTSLPVVCTYENKDLLEITEKPKSIIFDIFDKNIDFDMTLLYKNLKNIKI